MKPISYYTLVEWAIDSFGPFSCYSIGKRRSDRKTIVWSVEDFDFVVFPA